MTSYFKWFLILLCSLPVAQLSYAQQRTIDYTKEPVWIKMMDDPKTNYYEAVKAFEEYWKHHEMPVDEEELMGEENKSMKEIEKEKERERKKEKEKSWSEDDLKKQGEKEEMKYQVKRFKQWVREVKPFVQEDGRILSEEERMKSWKKQQDERKGPK